eukprot:scaffold200026_cov25-Tisochrysis_lutea.AAC.1
MHECTYIRIRSAWPPSDVRYHMLVDILVPSSIVLLCGASEPAQALLWREYPLLHACRCPFTGKPFSAMRNPSCLHQPAWLTRYGRMRSMLGDVNASQHDLPHTAGQDVMRTCQTTLM